MKTVIVVIGIAGVPFDVGIEIALIGICSVQTIVRVVSNSIIVLVMLEYPNEYVLVGCTSRSVSKPIGTAEIAA